MKKIVIFIHTAALRTSALYATDCTSMVSV
jgi:hypothetical protein